MTFKDQLQKFQGQMVDLILAVEDEGEPIRKSGRVYNCEDDHVAYLDGIGNLQYIAYAHIAHLQQSWDDENWPTEPK